MSRVLLIDDTKAVFESFHQPMAERGVDLYFVSNPLDSITEAARIEPDVIIIDYRFENAEINGLELGEKFAEHEDLKKIPRILLTGNDEFDQELELTAYQSGFSYYLSKPIPIEFLCSVIFKLGELSAYIARTPPVIEVDSQRILHLVTNGSRRQVASRVSFKNMFKYVEHMSCEGLSGSAGEGDIFAFMDSVDRKEISEILAEIGTRPFFVFSGSGISYRGRMDAIKSGAMDLLPLPKRVTRIKNDAVKAQIESFSSFLRIR